MQKLVLIPLSVILWTLAIVIVTQVIKSAWDWWKIKSNPLSCQSIGHVERALDEAEKRGRGTIQPGNYNEGFIVGQRDMRERAAKASDELHCKCGEDIIYLPIKGE